jgi:hypothetical protein
LKAGETPYLRRNEVKLPAWKRLGLTAVSLLLLVTVILLVTGWGTAVAANISSVLIANTASSPVESAIVNQPTVTVSGTPSVNVANSPTVTVSGTPTVQPIETPFQQFVSGSTDQSGSEVCVPIVSPAGKTLTIKSFSAKAGGTRMPDVYLQTVAVQGSLGNSIDSLHLDLRPVSSGWAGDLQTTLYSGGANNPDGWTFSYRVCVEGHDSGGFFLGNFRGVVSGTLS